MDPGDCPFLLNEKKNTLRLIYDIIDDGVNSDIVEEHQGLETIAQSPTDPNSFMLVYYPSRVQNLGINPYDEKLMKTMLDLQSVFTSESLPEAGFSKVENKKEEYVLAFSRGKFEARHAISMESGKIILQCLANLTWLSKTSCENGYTIMDGIHGLCDCEVTSSSVALGPDAIVMKERGLAISSREHHSDFFEKLSTCIYENITLNNMNKYLQVCNMNVREHINQLPLCESKEDAILKSKLVAKWIALHDFISTFYVGSSSKENLKILSMLLRHISNKDEKSIETMMMEAKGYSWPKNFTLSKMAYNARKYVSVRL